MVAVGDRPSVWSQPPTTCPELLRYALKADWCAPASRWLRLAGRIYCWTVAIPLSIAFYIAAWIIQRPGRLAAFLVLIAIVWLSISLST